jgi:hypothetical protein
VSVAFVTANGCQPAAVWIEDHSFEIGGMTGERDKRLALLLGCKVPDE